MKQYGAPYMGSKSKIAEDILAVLPRGRRFVDLFGGGFAMTHCAMLSGKYEEFYYNELSPLVVDMIKKAISGEYKNERRWIDRETFFNLKEKDGYVKYCWSFGNKGDSYLYAKEIEPWKTPPHTPMTVLIIRNFTIGFPAVPIVYIFQVMKYRTTGFIRFGAKKKYKT